MGQEVLVAPVAPEDLVLVKTKTRNAKTSKRMKVIKNGPNLAKKRNSFKRFARKHVECVSELTFCT